jgi:hypothetical protein
MTDSDVEVKFGANADEALASMSQVRFALQGLTAPLRGVRDNLGELAEAFVAAFAVEKLAGFVERMAELGLQTERTMAQLGLTSEQVGIFNGMATLTGTSVEGMTNGIERMSLNIQKSTKDAFNPAAEGLKVLGLNAKDLVGIPADQYFEKFAEAVSKFNPSLNLTSALMAAGGRGVAQMLPLLQKGAEGFKEYQEAIQKTGSVMSDETTAAFAKMHENITLMGMSFQGLSISLVSAFTPAINTIVGAITDLVQWFDKAIQEGGTFKGLLDLIVVVADAVAVAILSIVYTLEAVIQTVDLAFREIRDIVSGDLGAAKADMEAWQKSIEESARGWLARMKALIGDGTGQPSAPKSDAGGMDENAKNAATIAAAGIDAQIKAQQQLLAQKKLQYQEDEDNFQISQNQRYASVEAAIQDEYEAEKTLLQQKAAIWGQGTTQYAAVMKQITELDAKHASDVLKINAESVKAQTKLWNDMFASIEGAFNNQLRGLLAGTTTWADAMKAITGDLIIDLIEGFEKAGIAWAARELGMTTASTTGAAARATAEASASAAGAAKNYAESVAAIMRNSTIVFGGVFANLAPVMGPAAAGPAGAAQAAVAATVGELPPPLAVGAWNIPQDMTASLHAGEMVMPAPFAEAFRDNGGGGGDTYNVSISAIDSQSFAHAVQSNRAVIADAVGRHLKNNHRLMK